MQRELAVTPMKFRGRIVLLPKDHDGSISLKSIKKPPQAKSCSGVFYVFQSFFTIVSSTMQAGSRALVSRLSARPQSTAWATFGSMGR